MAIQALSIDKATCDFSLLDENYQETDETLIAKIISSSKRLIQFNDHIFLHENSTYQIQFDKESTPFENVAISLYAKEKLYAIPIHTVQSFEDKQIFILKLSKLENFEFEHLSYKMVLFGKYNSETVCLETNPIFKIWSIAGKTLANPTNFIEGLWKDWSWSNQDQSNSIEPTEKKSSPEADSNKASFNLEKRVNVLPTWDNDAVYQFYSTRNKFPDDSPLRQPLAQENKQVINSWKILKALTSTD